MSGLSGHTNNRRQRRAIMIRQFRALFDAGKLTECAELIKDVSLDFHALVWHGVLRELRLVDDDDNEVLPPLHNPTLLAMDSAVTTRNRALLSTIPSSKSPSRLASLRDLVHAMCRAHDGAVTDAFMRTFASAPLDLYLEMAARATEPLDLVKCMLDAALCGNRPVVAHYCTLLLRTLTEQQYVTLLVCAFGPVISESSGEARLCDVRTRMLDELLAVRVPCRRSCVMSTIAHPGAFQSVLTAATRFGYIGLVKDIVQSDVVRDLYPALDDDSNVGDIITIAAVWGELDTTLFLATCGVPWSRRTLRRALFAVCGAQTRLPTDATRAAFTTLLGVLADMTGAAVLSSTTIEPMPDDSAFTRIWHNSNILEAAVCNHSALEVIDVLVKGVAQSSPWQRAFVYDWDRICLRASTAVLELLLPLTSHVTFATQTVAGIAFNVERSVFLRMCDAQPGFDKQAVADAALKCIRLDVVDTMMTFFGVEPSLAAFRTAAYMDWDECVYTQRCNVPLVAALLERMTTVAGRLLDAGANVHQISSTGTAASIAASLLAAGDVADTAFEAVLRRCVA